ncbi:MAG: hypothetical protein ACU0GG_16105 [Paracoccaceae bacterium]
MFRLIANFTAMCLGFGTAFAGPDRASVLVGSHHANVQIEVEEINPGLFLEWQMDSSAFALPELRPDLQRRPSVVAGAFRNSFGDGAAALAVALPVFGEDAVQGDLFLGAAWYPGNGDQVTIAIGDIVPLGGLRLSYRNAFLLALPGDGETFDALFAFGLTFPLGAGP